MWFYIMCVTSCCSLSYSCDTENTQDVLTPSYTLKINKEPHSHQSLHSYGKFLKGLSVYTVLRKKNSPCNLLFGESIKMVTFLIIAQWEIMARGESGRSYSYSALFLIRGSVVRFLWAPLNKRKFPSATENAVCVWCGLTGFLLSRWQAFILSAV